MIELERLEQMRKDTTRDGERWGDPPIFVVDLLDELISLHGESKGLGPSAEADPSRCAVCGRGRDACAMFSNGIDDRLLFLRDIATHFRLGFERSEKARNHERLVAALRERRLRAALRSCRSELRNHVSNALGEKSSAVLESIDEADASLRLLDGGS